VGFHALLLDALFGNNPPLIGWWAGGPVTSAAPSHAGAVASGRTNTAKTRAASNHVFQPAINLAEPSRCLFWRS